MDLIKLFEMLVDFFLKLCEVSFTLGGFKITVGALFIWCAIATVVIGFIRGLTN